MRPAGSSLPTPRLVLAAVICFLFLAIILHDGFAVTLNHSDAPREFTVNTSKTAQLTPSSDNRFILSVQTVSCRPAYNGRWALVLVHLW